MSACGKPGRPSKEEVRRKLEEDPHFEPMPEEDRLKPGETRVIAYNVFPNRNVNRRTPPGKCDAF
jgi:hypothetical protein